MECWDRSRCLRLLPTWYHPVIPPHPKLAGWPGEYSQPGARLAGLLVPQGRLPEPRLPRPSLCLCAEGSMTLWKPLLSLERGTQLPPHRPEKNALPRPPALWHPANTQVVGYLTHTHPLRDRVGADRLDQRRRQRVPQGLAGMPVWGKDSGKTRGKERIKREWAGTRAPVQRERLPFVPMGWREVGRGPGSHRGCEGLCWMPRNPGSHGSPLPPSQMTFASSQRGEGEGTSGSIGGRG